MDNQESANADTSQPRAQEGRNHPPPTFYPPPAGLSLPGVQTGGPLPELFAAKAKARASFQAIERTCEVEVKTRDGRSYKFKYAPLDTVLAATMPALAENGLDLFWLLAEAPDGGAGLTCMLTHASGAYIATTMRLPPAEGPQARGSQITYGRRYQAQAVLGVASEEDDDGNAAAGNDTTVAPRERSQAPRQPAERPAPRREPATPPARDYKARHDAKPAAAGNGADAGSPAVARAAVANEPAAVLPPIPPAESSYEDREIEKPAPEPVVVPVDDVSEMSDAEMFGQVRTLAAALGIDSSNVTRAADICQEITGQRRMKDLDRAGVETLVRGLRTRVLAAESAKS